MLRHTGSTWMVCDPRGSPDTDPERTSTGDNLKETSCADGTAQPPACRGCRRSSGRPVSSAAAGQQQSKSKSKKNVHLRQSCQMSSRFAEASKIPPESASSSHCCEEKKNNKKLPKHNRMQAMMWRYLPEDMRNKKSKGNSLSSTHSPRGVLGLLVTQLKGKTLKLGAKRIGSAWHQIWEHK